MRLYIDPTLKKYLHKRCCAGMITSIIIDILQVVMFMYCNSKHLRPHTLCMIISQTCYFQFITKLVHDVYDRRISSLNFTFQLPCSSMKQTCNTSLSLQLCLVLYLSSILVFMLMLVSREYFYCVVHFVHR